MTCKAVFVYGTLQQEVNAQYFDDFEGAGKKAMFWVI